MLQVNLVDFTKTIQPSVAMLLAFQVVILSKSKVIHCHLPVVKDRMILHASTSQ